MTYKCYVDTIVDVYSFTQLDEAAFTEQIVQPMLAKLRKIFQAAPHDTFVIFNMSAIGRSEEDLAAIYSYPDAEE